jgi:hypothetical protein
MSVAQQQMPEHVRQAYETVEQYEASIAGSDSETMSSTRQVRDRLFPSLADCEHCDGTGIDLNSHRI